MWSEILIKLTSSCYVLLWNCYVVLKKDKMMFLLLWRPLLFSGMPQVQGHPGEEQHGRHVAQAGRGRGLAPGLLHLRDLRAGKCIVMFVLAFEKEFVPIIFSANPSHFCSEFCRNWWPPVCFMGDTTIVVCTKKCLPTQIFFFYVVRSMFKSNIWRSAMTMCTVT